MDRRKAIKNAGLFFGVTISATTIGTLFQSCQQKKRLDWTPSFFTLDEAQTISAIVDAMLPKTDTPGALDLKVDMFVDLMFEKALSSADQEHVRHGYEKFISTCKMLTGQDFTNLDTEKKAQVLAKVGAETNRFNPSIWGSTLGIQPPLDFYRRLRQFTLLGYYTSEEIGRNVLAYDPIPQVYEGCRALGPEDRTWTL